MLHPKKDLISIRGIELRYLRYETRFIVMINKNVLQLLNLY